MLKQAMRARLTQPFLAGLLLSVLLHLCIVASGVLHLPIQDDETAEPVIEALLAPAAKVAALPVEAKPPKKFAPKVAKIASAPAAKPSPPVANAAQPATPPESAPPAEDKTAPAATAQEPPLLAPVSTVAQTQPEPNAPSSKLMSIPDRVDIQYTLSRGIGSARQTLSWRRTGDQYTLTSVVHASGLAALVYQGQFVQISQGRIGAAGLEPETYWLQRGQTNRTETARFDYTHEIILTTVKGQPATLPLQGPVQDAVSFFFQMVLTVPGDPKAGSLSVVSGRKLRTYSYQPVGEEMLDTGMGTLKTLHISHRGGQDTGGIELWLAVDKFYLPVKVKRIESDGAEWRLEATKIETGV